MTRQARLRIETPEAMHRLGVAIGRRLRAGDVVVLDGPLGAGKTTLARGIGASLRVRGIVSSPTFVLARTHAGRAGGPPLVHVDAYRLRSPAELDDLDLDWSGSVAIVEWGAGMVEGLADSVLTVAISRPLGPAGDAAPDSEDAAAVEPREVELRGDGPRWADVTGLLPPETAESGRLT